MFIDSHCHLDRLDLAPYAGDLSAAVAAARDSGVTGMLCIGIDLDNAPVVIDIARRYPGVYATVGVHPMDIGDGEPDMQQLAALAADDIVLAIGETGLDYHYTPDSAELQKRSFRDHLQLAASLNKPVVVHTRDAREDTLELLSAYSSGPNAGGVLHCFTESWEMASSVLDMGFFISFSGIVTFRNAGELREVAARVPLDRLLIETDSPYLAPVPHRGKGNEPRFVVEVARCIAEIKGLSLEEVAEITSENFRELFL